MGKMCPGGRAARGECSRDRKHPPIVKKTAKNPEKTAVSLSNQGPREGHLRQHAC
jgi:hypothetical protein